MKLEVATINKHSNTEPVVSARQWAELILADTSNPPSLVEPCKRLINAANELEALTPAISIESLAAGL